MPDTLRVGDLSDRTTRAARPRSLTADEAKLLRWVGRAHHRFAPNPMGRPWVDLVAEGLIEVTRGRHVVRAKITEAGVEALQRGRRG